MTEGGGGGEKKLLDKRLADAAEWVRGLLIAAHAPGGGDPAFYRRMSRAELLSTEHGRRAMEAEGCFPAPYSAHYLGRE